MKQKSRKKQQQCITGIVEEAASTELPLTAFLSLFDSRENGGLVAHDDAVRYGNGRRTFRKCS